MAVVFFCSFYKSLKDPVRPVFRFRVPVGNADLDFQNLNPDFPIERTLRQLDRSIAVLQSSSCFIRSTTASVSAFTDIASLQTCGHVVTPPDQILIQRWTKAGVAGAILEKKMSNDHSSDKKTNEPLSNLLLEAPSLVFLGKAFS